MSKEFSPSRRRALGQGVLGAAAVAGGTLLQRLARAQSAEKLSPDDPLAQALKFVEDASQAPADLRDMNEFCHNCQFYQGEGESGTAPCMIFMGKLVPAGGWCNSWVMKGAGGSSSGTTG